MSRNDLKIGDKVIMNDKYYVSAENKEKIWTVRSDPWKSAVQQSFFSKDDQEGTPLTD